MIEFPLSSGAAMPEDMRTGNTAVILKIPMLRYKVLHSASSGSSGSHVPALILLHPMSSDEAYFETFLRLPFNLLVVSIRAPLNYFEGCQGFIWFRNEHAIQDIIQTSTSLHLTIEDLIKNYGVNPKAVYMLGYSQGIFIN